MLMGTYNHTVDPKGRLIIPAKFREELGEEFVITRGMDGCLFIYPMEQWKEFEAKIQKLSMFDKDARKLKRHFIASAQNCEPDKQGRFLIPASLRERAKIEKDVVVAGMTDHVELWSKELFDEYDDEDDIDAIAQKVDQKSAD